MFKRHRFIDIFGFWRHLVVLTVIFVIVDCRLFAYEVIDGIKIEKYNHDLDKMRTESRQKREAKAKEEKKREKKERHEQEKRDRKEIKRRYQEDKAKEEKKKEKEKH